MELKTRKKRLEPFPFYVGFRVGKCDEGDVASTWSEGCECVVSFSDAYDEKSWREAVPHEAVHAKQALEEYVEDRLSGETEAYVVEEICRRANAFLDGHSGKHAKERKR